jgi:hypothetical protein
MCDGEEIEAPIEGTAHGNSHPRYSRWTHPAVRSDSGGIPRHRSDRATSGAHAPQAETGGEGYEKESEDSEESEESEAGKDENTAASEGLRAGCAEWTAHPQTGKATIEWCVCP